MGLWHIVAWVILTSYSGKRNLFANCQENMVICFCCHLCCLNAIFHTLNGTVMTLISTASQLTHPSSQPANHSDPHTVQWTQNTRATDCKRPTCESSATAAGAAAAPPLVHLQFAWQLDRQLVAQIDSQMRLRDRSGEPRNIAGHPRNDV